MPCDSTGRNYSYAAQTQAIPRLTSYHQKLGVKYEQILPLSPRSPLLLSTASLSSSLWQQNSKELSIFTISDFSLHSLFISPKEDSIPITLLKLNLLRSLMTSTLLHLMFNSYIHPTWPVYDTTAHSFFLVIHSWFSFYEAVVLAFLLTSSSLFFTFPGSSFFLQSLKVPKDSILSINNFIYFLHIKYFLFASVTQIYISNQTPLL